MHRRGIDIERYPFGRQDRRATCYRDAVPTAPGVHGSSARPTTTWRCWACPRQARDMAREIRIARPRQRGRRALADLRRAAACGCLAWLAAVAATVFFYLPVIRNQSVKSQRSEPNGWVAPRPLVQSSGDQEEEDAGRGTGAAHKSAAVSAAIMADSFQPAKRASLCSAAVVKSFCDEACGSNGRARCGRLDLTEL